MFKREPAFLALLLCVLGTSACAQGPKGPSPAEQRCTVLQRQEEIYDESVSSAYQRLTVFGPADQLSREELANHNAYTYTVQRHANFVIDNAECFAAGTVAEARTDLQRLGIYR
ncbi:hypothetical protein ACU686_12375 [Yinghuangia aomiensis]